MDGRGGAAGSGSLLASHGHGVMPLSEPACSQRGEHVRPPPHRPCTPCLAVKVNGGGQLTIPFHLGWGTPPVFPRSLIAPNTTPRHLEVAQP